MTPIETTEPAKKHAPTFHIGEDSPTLLWRIGTVFAALTAGVVVAGTRIWESFYDEMKKTGEAVKKKIDALKKAGKTAEANAESVDGAGPLSLKKLRDDRHEQLDEIYHNAGEPEMLKRTQEEKFADVIGKRNTVDGAYTKAFNADVEARFGIVSGGVVNNLKGLKQRFIFIGRNNQVKALITGAIAIGATFFGAGLGRENNRLWKRLDGARQQLAQQGQDVGELRGQLAAGNAMYAPSGESFDRESTPVLGVNADAPVTMVQTHQLQRDTSRVAANDDQFKTVAASR